MANLHSLQPLFLLLELLLELLNLLLEALCVEGVRLLCLAGKFLHRGFLLELQLFNPLL